jgi:PTH1 family peptidyl-tRNA hydrolase
MNGQVELPIRIIVGLGNPGIEYEHTRHNIGFDILDAYTKACSFKWKYSLRMRGMVIKQSSGNANMLYLKPHTFMNASGRSVASAMKHLKATIEQVLCIHDDITLPLGAIKLSIGGGDGGHNGIKDIYRLIGNQCARLRVGIGSKGSPETELKDHVLGHFSDEESDQLMARMDFYRNSIDLILRDGPVLAMNTINQKQPNL